VKLGECSGIDLIGFYLCMRNQSNLQWIRDRDLPYLWAQDPNNRKRVPGCFQYDLIVGCEVVSKGRETVLVEFYSSQLAQSFVLERDNLGEVTVDIHSNYSRHF
jgi:hypothetical protein